MIAPADALARIVAGLQSTGNAYVFGDTFDGEINRFCHLERTKYGVDGHTYGENFAPRFVDISIRLDAYTDSPRLAIEFKDEGNGLLHRIDFAEIQEVLQ